MTIKALVNLNQKGNHLVWAGRGHQPECDYPTGTVIGEEITPCSEQWLQVETKDGKKLYVAHGNYEEVRD